MEWMSSLSTYLHALYYFAMAHLEIEIKSLLGDSDKATALKEKMCRLDPMTACISTNKQLNHYFKGDDVKMLYKKTHHLFDDEAQERFKKIVERGSDFSVRTRQKNEIVLLVVKASLDEGTSANTISRLEFEEEVGVTLNELDVLVLSAGFVYQAKWSRDREEYSYKGINVSIDRNAGYGYLAEFEKIIDDEKEISNVRNELVAIMDELGAEELPQDRLERMFEHYNKNWSEYYGTNKTFVIE